MHVVVTMDFAIIFCVCYLQLCCSLCHMDMLTLLYVTCFCLVHKWKAYGSAEEWLFLLYLSCLVIVCECIFCSYWPFLFQGGLSYLSLFSYKFCLCVLALVMFQMLHLNFVEYNIDFILGAICIIHICSFIFYECMLHYVHAYN